MSGAVIELGEFLLPGASAAEGARVAAAFHREVGRLWEADRAAGIGWSDTLGAFVLELDPAMRGEDLGQAIARNVRDRARLTHGGPA
ncbi:MAG: hypothetical protein J7500_00985 [Sphingomonas sp.]|uniref:hypothetical protein n=1 Tax=Sphingomonas sp. TaxID=28214 RepID=UPI001B18ECA6|nr:hypothetical protein [Sphingomonas sp.]MBO9621262.1 hypothetical protein [Sphingomonas sp.]